MATLSVGSKGIVVTSGLRFCVLNNANDPSLRFENDESIHAIPDPLPRTDVNEVPQVAKENLRILCSAVSTCGQFLAFADDHKQLTIWSFQGKKNTLLKQYNLVRRANKVIFDKTSSAILVADKSGDVFRFDLNSENDQNGQCLMGHLSMLLDIKLSKCGKFIITCDRDEKIRVSHYPNAYNIHNFCLGHTDFVTCIALHQETFLVSGSGDGTLRLWNYLKGKEMDQVLVAQDANLQPLEEQVDPKTHRTPWPSVLDVQEFETQLAISLEAFRGILLYQIQDEKLNFNRKVSIQSELWSFRFLNSNELIFIQACDVNPLVILQDDKEIVVPMKNSQEFFKDAMATPNSSTSFVEELHKRWFDNVKDYMEKKKEREEGQNETRKKIKTN